MSEHHNCDVPSQAVCSVQSTDLQNEKNMKVKDGVYLRPYCKQWQYWHIWQGGSTLGRQGRALTSHNRCDLGKSLKQQKEEFLHTGKELSRFERQSHPLIGPS